MNTKFIQIVMEVDIVEEVGEKSLINITWRQDKGQFLINIIYMQKQMLPSTLYERH